MRQRITLLVALALTLGLLAAPAGAAPPSGAFNISLEFSDPAPESCLTGEGASIHCITSDIAFWGNRAFVGNYNGARIYDISDPAAPTRIGEVACYGPQNDPSVWDTDGNGEADLLILSDDRTLAGPGCVPSQPAVLPANEDPTGWEGLRLFDVSDPANPQFIKAIYQDCGSHTNTLLPQPERGRLLVLNQSYPLRAGPTCGPVNGPAAGRDPLHGVIQVVEIPLNGSAQASGAAAHELTELPIDYPGDSDNLFDPDEHGFHGFNDLRACHDVAVYLPHQLVAAACAEQSQLWQIDQTTGLPDTSDPAWVFDQPNIDFHHSATFTWDGKIVNLIDESFGEGCPTVTEGVGQTGRMFFMDTDTGARLSHFMISRSHQKEEPDYCSAHLGNVVPATDRYLLVNAWYTGGVDVIDFSNPRMPREIAFWDDPGDNWSGYWYERNGSGPLNVFGTHGVEDPADSLGFQAFLANVSASRVGLDHLNPQVQEQFIATNPTSNARASAAPRRSAGTTSRNAGQVSPRKVARRLAP